MMQMCRRGTRNLAASARSRDPANLRAMLISCDSYLCRIHNDNVGATYLSVTLTTYKHYESVWQRYLVTARHKTSFYFVDKDAHMSQGFTDALSTKERMGRDEKCSGIIYLWVSLRTRARLGQKK